MHATAAPTPTTDPVEFVRSLPPHDQEAVLLYLLREVTRIDGGNGLIPFQTDDGEPMGYYVPPKVAAEQFEKHGPRLTPEQRAGVQRRIDQPGKTLSFDEMKEWLTGVEPAADPERG